MIHLLDEIIKVIKCDSLGGIYEIKHVDKYIFHIRAINV